MKKLMLGNEAVARGMLEAGCSVVSSYPGTPSTEITEFAAKYDEIYCEWAPNEKVACEVAFGASLSGSRAACCMKHVGLNVAADPLFTLSYTGVGGGLGCAIAYPQAKYLHTAGAEVDMIVGFRSRDLVILEDEMRAACTNLIMMTDDGSKGEKGFVTDALKAQLEKGVVYDEVIAIGPPVMMKFVSLLTKAYGVKTIVSMNPIMIDGTGMCGGCRVTVGGKIKFACVDGPEFDGHEVDFDELIRRNSAYAAQEREAEHRYNCNLMKQAEEK